MTRRLVVTTGFLLGMLISFGDACVTPFECIYIYVKRPQLCAFLEPVQAVDGGFIVDPMGESSMGCSCLSSTDEALLDNDYTDPTLDPLWDEILAAAQAQCEQFALDAGQDPSPCASAQLDKSSALATAETFDECKELAGTIDEDNDGVCPSLDETGDSGSNDETDTGDDNPPLVPDLGLQAP